MMLVELRWPYVDGFDPNVMAHNMGLYFERFFLGIRDGYVGMKRSTGYTWYIAETAFKDEDVAWETKAAEYFYYHEYKSRTRRYRRREKRMALANQLSKQASNIQVGCFDVIGNMKKSRRKSQARKDTNEISAKLKRAKQRLFYEFYCTPGMNSRHTNLCQWALLNKALAPRHLVVDRHTDPLCEQRRVHLDHHRFRTEGTFLRCTYQVQNDKYQPTGEKVTAFIKAVQRPAEYRLILYWLEEGRPEEEMPVQFSGATSSGYPGAGQNYVPPPYSDGAFGGYPHVGQNSIPYPNATEMAGTSSFPYPQRPTNAQQHNPIPSQNYYPYQAVDQNAHMYPKQYPQGGVPGQLRTDTQKYNQQQIPVPQTANTHAFTGPFIQPGSFNIAGRATAATTSAETVPDDTVSIDLKPPPLRVVYMLLNKRFSRNPAERLV